MQNIHGNLFGVYNNEVISKKDPEFWRVVLKDYVEVSDYERRLKFFEDHNLNFQTEYTPAIPFYYASTDFNGLLLLYEQDLKNQGIHEPYPTSPVLLEWYLNQDMENLEPDNLNTLEKRNLVVFHNRFKMNVCHHYIGPIEKVLFNSYLEKYILKNYPDISFESMRTDLLCKEVFNREIQINEKLNQIQEKIKIYSEKASQPEKSAALRSAEQLANLYDLYSANRDQYEVEAKDFLEGYSKCKTDGLSYIPLDKKISYDFILGKHTAQFEMILLSLKDSKYISNTETQRPTIRYKLLYLLMQRFGMFENESYTKLTTVSKAKLLSIILNVNSETIRQDLSNVYDFISEGKTRLIWRNWLTM